MTYGEKCLIVVLAPQMLTHQRYGTSAAVLPDEIIAIAVNGLVSAADAMPTISTARESLLHMEDPAPLPIVDGGTIAAPTISLWQQGSIGLRLLFEIDWKVRDPRAIAWMTGAKR
jgi:hypothetical protein